MAPRKSTQKTDPPPWTPVRTSRTKQRTTPYSSGKRGAKKDNEPKPNEANPKAQLRALYQNLKMEKDLQGLADMLESAGKNANEVTEQCKAFYQSQLDMEEALPSDMPDPKKATGHLMVMKDQLKMGVEASASLKNKIEQCLEATSNASITLKAEKEVQLMKTNAQRAEKNTKDVNDRVRLFCGMKPGGQTRPKKMDSDVVPQLKEVIGQIKKAEKARSNLQKVMADSQPESMDNLDIPYAEMEVDRGEMLR
ncbi:uncharacterized protein N7529_003639 [Penicillium soppii]|uniref:uncharacterized protein n=1 Tax=Penicillium soppii TaxID=69789 RepID=UPI002546CF63|nr:uncharacterized protein N7529_003639 [Penicillium soppii]KAJ5871286.1 hypothetical protein N7529_003639 [Penicillium soppii]